MNETEVANLLMTCTVPEQPDVITVQINLGSVLLKFQDLNQTLEFQPSTLGNYCCTIFKSGDTTVNIFLFFFRNVVSAPLDARVELDS